MRKPLSYFVSCALVAAQAVTAHSAAADEATGTYTAPAPAPLRVVDANTHLYANPGDCARAGGTFTASTPEGALCTMPYATTSDPNAAAGALLFLGAAAAIAAGAAAANHHHRSGPAPRRGGPGGGPGGPGGGPPR